MIKIISAAQMRDLDLQTSERFAVPSLLLMETAAVWAARIIASRLPKTLKESRVAIFCGPGNNGGDGAALARHLALRGARVDVLLCGKREATKGDARVNFEMLAKLAAPPAELPGLAFRECEDPAAFADFVARWSGDALIDALFGTGLSRPLTGLYEQVVAHLNHMRTSRPACVSIPQIVSLDLPSGLDADSGELIGPAVTADLTITFTAPKLANVLPPAGLHSGLLEVAHIGTPPSLISAAHSQIFLAEKQDAVSWLTNTRLTSDSHKNSRGHALIIAGSRKYTGAAVLTANAAMRFGAGLVTLATPASALPLIAPRLMPEIMSIPLTETPGGAVAIAALGEVAAIAKRATVLAVGPGLSSAEESTREFVRELAVNREKPMVIDADGLNALSPWPDELRGTPDVPLVLTPHLGEMRRLVKLESDAEITKRQEIVGEFAALHSLFLILKGARILIGAPSGQVVINSTGNPGAGTAGAGDTLTGIIAGSLAQSLAGGRSPEKTFESVVAGIYIAGLACDLAAQTIGMRSLTASDIREHLAAALCALDPEGERP